MGTAIALLLAGPSLADTSMPDASTADLTQDLTQADPMMSDLTMADSPMAGPTLAGLLDGLPSIGNADPGGSASDRLADQPAAPRITAAQAAARARAEHAGKVLSVDLQQRGQDAFYRVKLIHNGNVRTVRVPAR